MGGGVQSILTRKRVEEVHDGDSCLDSGRADRRLARRSGHEGRRLRRTGWHHSRHFRRLHWRLGIRTVRNLAGRRRHWRNHRGLCRCGDPDRDYALDQAGLMLTHTFHYESISGLLTTGLPSYSAPPAIEGTSRTSSPSWNEYDAPPRKRMSSSFT